MAGVSRHAPGVQDVADAAEHHLPVQGGDVIQIHRQYLPLRREPDHEIPGLEGGLLGDLETAGVGVGVLHREKLPVVLVEHAENVVRLAGKQVAVARVDGHTQHGERPHQRGHGDEQKPAAQCADHSATSRV